MVYGANAETMKKICSVLAECAAFNSKGWIKLSTGPKTPSTDIDVYIKDTSAVLNNVSVRLLCLVWKKNSAGMMIPIGTCQRNIL